MKSVKEREHGRCTSVQLSIWNLKPAEVILRRVVEEREDNGGDEPNWDMCICKYENVTLKPYTTIVY
jgi:hypothetical protein